MKSLLMPVSIVTSNTAGYLKGAGPAFIGTNKTLIPFRGGFKYLCSVTFHERNAATKRSSSDDALIFGGRRRTQARRRQN